MSDNSSDKDTVGMRGDLLANEIHFASAFVTPFAAAVAIELEEFGLSKKKIDEIMLRSAERFGSLNGEERPSRSGNAAESDNRSADYLGWISAAGSEAVGFIGSFLGKTLPVLWDKLTPIFINALEQAISDHVKASMRPSGETKSKKSRR